VLSGLFGGLFFVFERPFETLLIVRKSAAKANRTFACDRVPAAASILLWNSDNLAILA
jgi:hypothetical protein